MRPHFLVLTICACLALSSCDLTKLVPKTSYTTTKAPVLKVYAKADGGHNFIAYVVDAGGTEVVVSDPLGRTKHKVGDTIEYMTQKIEVTGGKKSLSYVVLK